MKNRFSAVLAVLILMTCVHDAYALGDSRLRVKLDMKQLSPTKKIAIVAFAGNSVVTGNMGLGSLVTGALAKKNQGGGLSLNNTYMSTIYDMFTKTLANEGYSFLPAEDLVKTKAYQDATTVEMPSFVDAKGLKQVNVSKEDTLKQLASETGADIFFHVTSGHSLGMRSNLGTVVGKQIGIATTMVVVYDSTGKKLGYIDASDVSNSAIGSVAGGFADPNKVMPLLEEADQQMISKLAAKISLKN
jgi:hypothetical protein